MAGSRKSVNYSTTKKLRFFEYLRCVTAGVCCLSWDNQPTGSNWRLQTDLVQLEQNKSLHYSTTSSYNDNEDDNYLEVTNINALMHVI